MTRRAGGDKGSMVEAFVGLVGGGKSFSSVKRMCNYIASGGVANPVKDPQCAL